MNISLRQVKGLSTCKACVIASHACKAGATKRSLTKRLGSQQMAVEKLRPRRVLIHTGDTDIPNEVKSKVRR